MAQNCQVDATSSSSREDRSAEATPTSIMTVDFPVAENSRSPEALKHPPGLRLTSSGKWGVRIRHPFKRAQIWLGSYTTVEEATNIYNKKKLEYASLRSELCEEDASFRVDESKPDLATIADASFKVDESKPGLATSTEASLRVVESKSSMGKPNCIVLALSAKESKDTPRKKSGLSSVQNRLEKFFMAKKCRHEITSSSKEDGSAVARLTSVDIPVAKKSRSLGEERHPGLRITPSGKYGVQIRHPITRSKIWLGSYCTIEEAKNIYNTKKLEYESLKPTATVVKNKKHSVLKATPKFKGKAKGKGKRKRKKLVIEGITIWQTPSGKWGRSVRDPVSKLNIWLGSHATPEEAVESYNRKKLEFDPSYDRGCVGEGCYGVHDSDFLEKEAVNGACSPAGDTSDVCSPRDVTDTCIRARDVADTCVPACHVADVCIPAHDVASAAATNSTGVERPVVKLTGTDKWRVAVRHPMLKHSLSLGSYDTAEEAEEVYNRNKVELDAVLHSDRIGSPKADVASPTAVASEGVHVKKYTGVRPSGTGRWMSQIQSPLSKKNKVHLGTFKTAEEAAEAFNRTRREFDAIVSLVKKGKHEADSEARKAKSKSKKPVILEQDVMPIDERTRLFEIVVESHSQNPNSAITVVSSQGFVNNSNDNQIVEVSPAEQEFGTDVVDSYGQLVGEYSRLDDELWLSRPGDKDDFDVHGAFFNGNGELDWDPSPKPSLFLLTDEMEGGK